MTETFNLANLQSELAGKNPRVILRTALEQFERIAVSFSGAEDVVLVDLASQIRPGVEVFCLDTGRLHAETYRLIEEVRKKYPIRLEVLSPDASAVNELVRQKGLFSFYEDGHSECCGIRKVQALQKNWEPWMRG